MAVLIALFAEPLRQWFFRPKLVADFDFTDDYITPTPEFLENSLYQARYVRIKVTNKSARLAKACRAFLVQVERETGPGSFAPTPYCDSIQLPWSVRADGYAPVDIPQGIPHFLDVLSTREGVPFFSPKLAFMPLRYQPIFFDRQVVYRLTIRISGDWVTPASIRLRFAWNGQWDGFSVTPA